VSPCRSTDVMSGDKQMESGGKIEKIGKVTEAHAVRQRARPKTAIHDALYQVAVGDGKQLHFWKMIDVLPFLLVKKQGMHPSVLNSPTSFLYFPKDCMPMPSHIHCDTCTRPLGRC
jgi:hypothetical protein